MVNKWNVSYSSPACSRRFLSIWKVYRGWKPIKWQQVELWCGATPSSSSDLPLPSFSFSSSSCRSIKPPPSSPSPFCTNPTINLNHNPLHKSPNQFSSLPPLMLHFSGSSQAHVIISAQASPFLSPPRSPPSSLALPSCLPACLHLSG